MFSILVETLCEDSTCQVEKNSKQAGMLRQVWLIVWDESVTQHRYTFLQYRVICSLTNLTFQDTRLKQSTAHFRTFLQQTNHLPESLSSSEVTSNRRCLSLPMEHEKTLCKLRCSTLPYGVRLKSYISIKTCEFSSMPTRMLYTVAP
jgi:hypothetical protein